LAKSGEKTMGFYEQHILPRFINCACGTKPIMKQREKVVPRASGTVLEIGIGTGLNLPYYDATRVERLIGLDPSEKSWELAGKRAAHVEFDVEFIGLPGEQIPLEDGSVDTVLVTFSLCTIPDPVAALHGMARVLRPGGSLIFCEHGKAPDANVCQWQDRINPIWRRIVGGCHVNRDIPQLLKVGGFDVVDMETSYLPGTPKFAGYNFWGSARVA
jgi:ubiquinone/menaquinone biosynthesis C-methylase UbiE